MSTLNLQEGFTYPQPTHHYQTDQIVEVAYLVEGLLEGAELFDELEEQLHSMALNFEDFERVHWPQMEALLLRESRRFAEDAYNHQVPYCMNTGLKLFAEGCEAFEDFFESESDNADELLAAFNLIRDGNDYVCLALELAQGRLLSLQSIIKAHPQAA